MSARDRVYRRVVLATSNAGKLKELAALLDEFAVELVAQSEYQVDSVEETGLSFVENAIIKARHAARVTGVPAIADDSGICVDALNGEPGIYSARYAGAAASDAENVAKLLGKMRDVADAKRSARFECVVAFLEDPVDPTPLICHGSWAGRVLHQPRGENGFGYDPVFYIPTARCSCAELDSVSKNRLSHRGQAIRQLVNGLREKLAGSN